MNAPPRPVSEKERNSWESRAQLHRDELRERIRKQGESSLYDKIFSNIAFFAFALLLINGIRMLIEWIF